MYFFTNIDLFTKTLEVCLFWDEEYFLKKQLDQIGNA